LACWGSCLTPTYATQTSALCRNPEKKKLVHQSPVCYLRDMEPPIAQHVQTVTEITATIRAMLETELPFVSVIGEISNIRQPYSGHLYFTLKDTGAQLKAVLFKPQQRYLSVLPEDGMEVICRGRLSVYEPRGEYQLIVDFLDLKGSGALQILLEQLKKKLATEGLFDQAHKKKIPFLPERIAVVTSPQGAAVRDFLRIGLARYAGIPVTVYPVRVQGEGAAEEIIRAIRFINEHDRAEVIVLCRGGGSVEDLWAFNDEKLARAIHASQIPVVSAIGHETDFTIADFVADLRVATPTAAAEAVIPNKRMLSERIAEISSRLSSSLKRKISNGSSRVQASKRLLGDPSLALDHYRLATDHAITAMHHAITLRFHKISTGLSRLHHKVLSRNPDFLLRLRKQKFLELNRRLTLAMDKNLNRKEAALAQKAALLDSLSPLAILSRGYAIVRSTASGQIIRAAEQTTINERLRIKLHQGEIDCRVVDLENS